MLGHLVQGLVMRAVPVALVWVVMRQVVVDAGRRGVPGLVLLLVVVVGPALVLMVPVIVELLAVMGGVGSLVGTVTDLVLEVSPVVDGANFEWIFGSGVASEAAVGSREIICGPLDTVVDYCWRVVHHTI